MGRDTQSRQSTGSHIGCNSLRITLTLAGWSHRKKRAPHGVRPISSKLSYGDYTSTSGTLTFNPGDTSKTLTVNVTVDTKLEPNETFNVDLIEVNASDHLRRGTIQNDDVQPAISINDVSQAEGGGTTAFNVMSNPICQTITVDFRTTDGTDRDGRWRLHRGERYCNA